MPLDYQELSIHLLRNKTKAPVKLGNNLSNFYTFILAKVRNILPNNVHLEKSLFP